MGEFHSTTKYRCLQEAKKKKKEKEKKQPRSLNFRSSVPFPISVTVKKIMPFVSKLRAKEISNSHDKCTGVESSASIKSKFLVFVGFCVCVLLCVVAFIYLFILLFFSQKLLAKENSPMSMP